MTRDEMYRYLTVQLDRVLEVESHDKRYYHLKMVYAYLQEQGFELLEIYLACTQITLFKYEELINVVKEILE